VKTHVDALANVYAHSLFELATDGGGNERAIEVSEELEQICELTRQERGLGLFFSSPVIDVTRRGEALTTIFTNRVTDLTLRFLLVLNLKGRLNHLEAISTAFDALIQEALGRVEVDVFTPTPIGAESINIIKARVTEMLGKEPVLHPYIDSSMLGGIKLRIGDQLIDGSVQTRLRRLSELLKTRGSTAIRDRFESYVEENNQ